MIRLMQPFVLGAALVLSGNAALAQERDAAQEEANRQLVLEFYDGFFNRHDAGAADVVANNYIQHNPEVPDGKEPFVGYFTGFFAENPESKARIVRSAADGDLVWLHIHSTNGADDPGQAVVDIFRVEDGMIVEHWDVIQPVPTEAANDNTMF
ncbi:MAG: nuclear transport factor 2 family protein [Paracoccus sp. (in: a-proteobacteria)]|uniref:nuclear transport factor 2 family protein n=1 Tax=Paracoccus sp. TaxID=267 RepID=UPI0026E0A570|nr:nuclear transport factor 2 family protein [Paracoccus sp. (in: a-proteobacteria)]MDO5632892.1 nuclear transport factor 2 family protein [Paracoccus sp. (in: a-proteobacteria)]